MEEDRKWKADGQSRLHTGLPKVGAHVGAGLAVKVNAGHHGRVVGAGRETGERVGQVGGIGHDSLADDRAVGPEEKDVVARADILIVGDLQRGGSSATQVDVVCGF